MDDDGGDTVLDILGCVTDDELEQDDEEGAQVPVAPASHGSEPLHRKERAAEPQASALAEASEEKGTQREEAEARVEQEAGAEGQQRASSGAPEPREPGEVDTQPPEDEGSAGGAAADVPSGGRELGTQGGQGVGEAAASAPQPPRVRESNFSDRPADWPRDHPDDRRRPDERRPEDRRPDDWRPDDRRPEERRPDDRYQYQQRRPPSPPRERRDNFDRGPEWREDPRRDDPRWRGDDRGDRPRDFRDHGAPGPREPLDNRPNAGPGGGPGVGPPGGYYGQDAGHHRGGPAERSMPLPVGGFQDRALSQTGSQGSDAVARHLHRVFVTGISGGGEWLDRTVLTREFDRFGHVLDVFLPKHKKVAYISFDHPDALERALQHEKLVVRNCEIRLLRAEPRPAEAATPTSGTRQPLDNFPVENEALRDSRNSREQPSGGRFTDSQPPRSGFSGPVGGSSRPSDRPSDARGPEPRGLPYDSGHPGSNSRLELHPSRAGQEQRSMDSRRASPPRQQAGPDRLQNLKRDRDPPPQCGVGMVLNHPEQNSDGCCVVSQVTEGGALSGSKVRVGDRLLSVNGFNCRGVPRDEIKKHVVGPAGSEVVLLFWRHGFGELQVRVTRMVTQSKPSDQPRTPGNQPGGWADSGDAKRQRTGGDEHQPRHDQRPVREGPPMHDRPRVPAAPSGEGRQSNWDSGSVSQVHRQRPPDHGRVPEPVMRGPSGSPFNPAQDFRRAPSPRDSMRDVDRRDPRFQDRGGGDHPDFRDEHMGPPPGNGASRDGRDTRMGPGGFDEYPPERREPRPGPGRRSRSRSPRRMQHEAPHDQRGWTGPDSVTFRRSPPPQHPKDSNPHETRGVDNKVFLTAQSGGMSWLNQDVIYSQMNRYGRIIEIIIPAGKKFAYVAYESVQSYDNALRDGDIVIDGCQIKLLPAKAKQNQREPAGRGRADLQRMPPGDRRFPQQFPRPSRAETDTSDSASHFAGEYRVPSGSFCMPDTEHRRWQEHHRKGDDRDRPNFQHADSYRRRNTEPEGIPGLHFSHGQKRAKLLDDSESEASSRITVSRNFESGRQDESREQIPPPAARFRTLEQLQASINGCDSLLSLAQCVEPYFGANLNIGVVTCALSKAGKIIKDGDSTDLKVANFLNKLLSSACQVHAGGQNPNALTEVFCALPKLFMGNEQDKKFLLFLCDSVVDRAPSLESVPLLRILTAAAELSAKVSGGKAINQCISALSVRLETLVLTFSPEQLTDTMKAFSLIRTVPPGKLDCVLSNRLIEDLNKRPHSYNSATTVRILRCMQNLRGLSREDDLIGALMARCRTIYVQLSTSDVVTMLVTIATHDAKVRPEFLQDVAAELQKRPDLTGTLGADALWALLTLGLDSEKNKDISLLSDTALDGMQTQALVYTPASAARLLWSLVELGKVDEAGQVYEKALEAMRCGASQLSARDVADVLLVLDQLNKEVPLVSVFSEDSVASSFKYLTPSDVSFVLKRLARPSLCDKIVEAALAHISSRKKTYSPGQMVSVLESLAVGGPLQAGSGRGTLALMLIDNIHESQFKLGSNKSPTVPTKTICKAVSAMRGLMLKPHVLKMSAFAAAIVKSKDQLSEADALDTLCSFLELGWQGDGESDVVAALCEWIAEKDTIADASAASAVLLAIIEHQPTRLVDGTPHKEAACILLRCMVSAPIKKVEQSLYFEVMKALGSCAVHPPLLVCEHVIGPISDFADHVTDYGHIYACSMLSALARSGADPGEGIIPALINYLSEERAKMNTGDLTELWEALGELRDEMDLEKLRLLVFQTLSCLFQRVQSVGPLLMDGLEQSSKDTTFDSPHQRFTLIANVLWAVAVLTRPRSGKGATELAAPDPELFSNCCCMVDILAVSYHDLCQVSAVIPHDIDWILLPKLHLFFLYSAAIAGESWKAFVGDRAVVKALVHHSYVRFVDARGAAFSACQVTTQIRQVARDLGVLFDQGVQFEESTCGAGLVLRDLKIAVLVVDCEDLIVSTKQDAQQDLSTCLRGSRALIEWMWQTMGWKTVHISASQWLAMGHQKLAQKMHLCHDSVLRTVIMPRLGAVEHLSYDEKFEGRESVLMFFESTACFQGSLQSLEADHLVHGLKRMSEDCSDYAGGFLDRTMDLISSDVFMQRMSTALLEVSGAAYAEYIAAMSQLYNENPRHHLLCKILSQLERRSLSAEQLQSMPLADQLRYARNLVRLGSQVVEQCKDQVQLILKNFSNKHALAGLDPQMVAGLLYTATMVCGQTGTHFEWLSGLLDQAFSSSMLSSFTKQDLVDLIEAFPFTTTKNVKQFRIISERIAPYVSSLHAKEITLIARAHVKASHCLDNLQEALVKRIKSPVLISCWHFADSITLLVASILLEVYDPELTELLVVLLLSQRHPLAIRDLTASEVVELLWCIAALWKSRPEQHFELGELQMMLVAHLSDLWERNLLSAQGSKPAEKGLFSDMQLEMLRQYLVFLRQDDHPDVLVRIPESLQVEIKEVGSQVDRMRLNSLSEERREIAKVLQEIKVQVEENAVAEACGYALGFKFVNDSTTLEMYAKSDCIQSSGAKGLTHKPGALWQFRLKQIRQCGITVLTVGFEQWAGLKKSEEGDGGDQFMASAEWLMKLINTGIWAQKYLHPSFQVDNQVDPVAPAGSVRWSEVFSGGSNRPGSSDHSDDEEELPPERRTRNTAAIRSTQPDRTWSVHLSKTHSRWYYSNNETGAKVWKPPEIKGWLLKESSGEHPPYIGLMHYYFNPRTKHITYDPPDPDPK